MWKRRILWAALFSFARMGMAEDGTGGGGGGDAAAGGNGGGDPAAAGGAAAGGADAAAAGGAAAASVLQAGADAGGDPSTWIPEKYQVKKEDGTLDMDQSARKLAEAHSSLEKRMGSGDAPPKSADDYTLSLPDTFKDVDVRADPDMKEFLTEAQGAGLSQKQMDVVMKAYAKMSTTLAQGGAAATAEDCTTDLRKSWASDADYNRNVGLAYSAVNAAAQKAGISVDQVDQALGNNPTFLRLMAALGPEFSEDTSVGGTSIQATSQEDIEKLMTSDAYMNPKHVDHAKVSERVRKYFERKHGTDAVA